MFFQHNRHENHDPIPHERHKVLEDEEQVISPGDGADEIDEHDDTDPQPARYHFRVTAQNLASQRRSVRAGAVVVDDAQRDDDAAEVAEAIETAVAGEDQGARRGVGGFLPEGITCDTASEAHAEHVYEDEGGEEASEGHEEGFVAAGGLGVIDVEVRGGGGPGDGDGELEGEEGEAVCCYGAGVADGWEGGIERGAGGADEDEEDNSLGDPGPSLQ